MTSGPEHVVSSCAAVVAVARHVVLKQDAIHAAATSLLERCRQGVTWDEEGWHYSLKEEGAAGASEERTERAARYLLLLDALNFCFWPDESWEYDRLACALASAAAAYEGYVRQCGGSNAELTSAPLDPLDPANWSNATEATLATWVGGRMPNAAERVRLVREIGNGVTHSWGGSVSHAVYSCEKSACRLVDLVTATFAGFRDASNYRGNQVHLLKRAQIFVADVVRPSPHALLLTISSGDGSRVRASATSSTLTS